MGDFMVGVVCNPEENGVCSGCLVATTRRHADCRVCGESGTYLSGLSGGTARKYLEWVRNPGEWSVRGQGLPLSARTRGTGSELFIVRRETVDGEAAVIIIDGRWFREG
jgi:hypothetical protein